VKIRELIQENLPKGSVILNHAIDMINRLIHFEYVYNGKKWRASIKLHKSRWDGS